MGINSIVDYFVENKDSLIVVLSLDTPPNLFSCNVPRGQLFDPKDIPWKPTTDFTNNNATKKRFHILRLHQSDPRTECKLKHIFSSCGVKLNSQSAIHLDDKSVRQLKGQIAKCEKILLSQSFPETPFDGTQPVFRVNGKEKP